MTVDIKKMEEQLAKALKNLTKEDIEKYFPKRNIPFGWVSIEEHLPMWMGVDAEKGYSEYKVKYADGKKGESRVTDHSYWYYMAKDADITHWWNEFD